MGLALLYDFKHPLPSPEVALQARDQNGTWSFFALLKVQTAPNIL